MPIHKGDGRTKALNYWKLCITSAVVKILEGIVNTASPKHFATINLLSKHQYGFQPGKSVETNLIDSYYYITELLDQSLRVDVVLLDFSKAFDKVCHQRLQLNLKVICIEEDMVDRIMSFLKGRKQQIRAFGEGWYSFLF